MFRKYYVDIKITAILRHKVSRVLPVVYHWNIQDICGPYTDEWLSI